MARPKGSPKLGGRQKGTPNKTTASAKQALSLAFDAIGGYEAMVRWAKRSDENMRAFYGIWSKLVPTDLTTGGQPLVKTKVIRPNAE